MPELRVVAVSNDGTRLVLKAADSTEYTLPIDERLRAAVRGDRPRLGQIEIEVESHLRPRDIQARIRAGATAEEVAQMAGIPVDRVRRFEGPVLAERAFMAERARKTPVRRPGENAGPQLGEAVQERLLLRGVEKDTVQWDSWRRDDGTWEVLLVYRVAGEPHSASWTYDPPRRLVQAVDEEARSLIGESDDLAVPEPSFPFVPRIARLPRDRPLDRALERGPSLPVPSTDPVEEATAERDSLTSLLEAVPSFRGDLVVPERPRSPPRPWRSPRRTRGGGAPGPGGLGRFGLRGCPHAPFGRQPPRPPHRLHRPPGRGRRRPPRPPRGGPELGRDRVRHPPQEAGVAGRTAWRRPYEDEGPRRSAAGPPACAARVRPGG